VNLPQSATVGDDAESLQPRLPTWDAKGDRVFRYGSRSQVLYLRTRDLCGMQVLDEVRKAVHYHTLALSECRFSDEVSKAVHLPPGNLI